MPTDEGDVDPRSVNAVGSRGTTEGHQHDAVTSTSDPLEDHPPDIAIEARSAAEARRSVTGSAALDVLVQDELEGLVNAVSEVTTNALHHGEPPVTLRAWVGEDRVVVIVRDEGSGPDEAELGLAPIERAPGEGGYGLWLAHLLTAEVTMCRHAGGFEVRLVAGCPFVAP